jgi:hypothetical protein
MFCGHTSQALVSWLAVVGVDHGWREYGLVTPMNADIRRWPPKSFWVE